MKGIEKIKLKGNINLTLIKTDKFKSNLISIYIQRLLDRDEVTKNALIPSIIKSGCEKYKSTREISKVLDNLYGATVLADASKRGERQLINFKIVSTNEKYLDEKILKDIIAFLDELINRPLVQDGGFDEKYVDLEKQSLRNKIQAVINDKGSYAVERCFEEMCKDERYSISEYGYEEDIDNITSKELYKHYKNILKTSPIDIVVEGDFEKEEVVSLIEENFTFDRENIIKIPREDYTKEVKEVKNIKESMDITQGKLVIGYRTNIDFNDTDIYYPLVIASSILGGGPHSKLFLNVREKESLCYYIYSSVEKYKGILFIGAGIEFENYDKVLKIIEEQLNDLKSGKISNEELENSKIGLINSMKSVDDSIGGMSDFYFSQSLSKKGQTLEEMIKRLEKITVEDVVKSSKDITLDTVYFLKN